MWDGIERRSTTRYCDGHINLCEDMAIVKTTVVSLDKRIGESIRQIEKHIDNSRPRNIAIASALISIILFLLKFSYSLGESNKQINLDTVRLDKIEATYYKVMHDNTNKEINVSSKL